MTTVVKIRGTSHKCKYNYDGERGESNTFTQFSKVLSYILERGRTPRSRCLRRLL